MENKSHSNQFSTRIDSIDALRGLIMILMTLDHVRDFWFIHDIDPTHLLETSEALFFTRWVTHVCAPVFIFLAGTGVFLSIHNGKERIKASRQLVARGLLMILIEVLYLSKLWMGSSSTVLFQVFWALGCSMIVLAFVIWLPKKWIFAFALIQIFGHNLLDDFYVSQGSPFFSIWAILHKSHVMLSVMNFDVWVLYPLIPWMGVMALGYLFGEWMVMDQGQRKVYIRRLAVWMSFTFIALRLFNIYGNPSPYSIQKTPSMTLVSFLNCEKYPPSLQFLLMTGAVGLLLLYLFENSSGKGIKVFKNFGGVPMFYYLIHLPLIIGLFHVRQGIGIDNFQGYELMGVYIVWIGIVILMYPICMGYRYLKAHKSWRWLKYI